MKFHEAGLLWIRCASRAYWIKPLLAVLVMEETLSVKPFNIKVVLLDVRHHTEDFCNVCWGNFT